MPNGTSLSIKLPLLVSVISFSVAVTTGAVLVNRESRDQRVELEQKALLLGRSMALLAPEPILRHDSWSLYKSLKQITGGLEGSSGPVVAAMVLDEEGKVLADIDPARHPLGLPPPADGPNESKLLDIAMASRDPLVLAGQFDFLEGVAPVIANGKHIGVVRIRLSTADLQARTWEGARTTLGYALGLALAGSLVGSWLALRVSRRLRSLARQMAAFVGKDRAWIEPSGDEVRQLDESFRRMTQELDEKRRAAEELARSEKLISLGHIAAGVAHEVNNPLGGMLNCISTLKARPGDQALVDRYIPVIEKGLNRIRAIVQDLLVDVRSQEICACCDMSCMGEVRDLVAMEIQGRGIDFHWSVDIGGTLRLHRPCVQQVVLNLLRNAAEAMPEGGILALDTHRRAGSLVIEVKDTGGGISQDARNHIFEPFFTTRPSGTGLGLWIVYRLVQSMNGTVEVESEVGRGSTFRVVVPVQEDAHA